MNAKFHIDKLIKYIKHDVTHGMFVLFASEVHVVTGLLIQLFVTGFAVFFCPRLITYLLYCCIPLVTYFNTYIYIELLFCKIKPPPYILSWNVSTYAEHLIDLNLNCSYFLPVANTGSFDAL